MALIIGVAFHTKATGYMPQTSGETNEETHRDQAAPASLPGRLEETVSQPAIRLWTKQARRIPALLAVPQIFFQTHCQSWQTYSLARGWDER